MSDAKLTVAAPANGKAGTPRQRARRKSLEEALARIKVTAADKSIALKLGMSVAVIKALKLRRVRHFPNKIDGAVTQGRLSRSIFCSYAAPSFSTVPLTVLLSVYGVQFYERIGARLPIVAFFQALARGFDVVTDPSMSYITDSCRSKHGRRRPFLITGCVPYALCLMALLSPVPSFGPTAVSVWFGCFYILFFLFNTYTNIPYDAMAPELTDNQDDRSKLFFLCTIFDGLGGLCAVLLPVGLQVAINIFRPTSTAGPISCDEPVDGKISVMRCTGYGGWSLSDDWRAFSRPMNQSLAEHGYTTENCLAAFDLTEGVYCGSVELRNWCECRDICDAVVKMDNTRGAYSLVGIFFGLWYVVTMCNAVYRVKERSQMAGGKRLKPPAPMLPSMLNTFNNRPFKLLLPAWVCDALVNSIISSLLTYFVRYVVQPEFAKAECKGGRSSDWKCSSEKVLGMSVVAVLVAAFCSTPMWLYLAKQFGKRNTWLLWSLTMALTNLLFLAVGPGDVFLCIAISALNGLPMSAKFLADAILADVIDYDEFLTGQRAEATYTMFKSFLPKIAAIPASAVPIALLGVFGHIAPKNGVIQKQVVVDADGTSRPNTALEWYIRTAIIIIPSFLSFLAFIFKARFPFKTKAQNRMISTGIGQHLLGESSKCPVSGLDYALVRTDDTPEAMQKRAAVDCFPGADVSENLLANPKKEAAALHHKAKVQLAAALSMLLAAMIGTALTASMLTPETAELAAEPVVSSLNWTLSSSQCAPRPAGVAAGQDLSFIPVLFIVLFGTAITAVGATYLRIKASSKLVANPPKGDIVKDILLYRKQRAKAAAFKVQTFECSPKSHTDVEPTSPRRATGSGAAIQPQESPQERLARAESALAAVDSRQGSRPGARPAMTVSSTTSMTDVALSVVAGSPTKRGDSFHQQGRVRIPMLAAEPESG